MNARLPIITLAVVLASLGATLSPLAVDLLVYDRQGILQGELWRLLSGHLVHFSRSHLAGDVVVFGVVGGLIERRRGLRVGVLYLVMAAVIGIGMLVLKPDLAQFGGLSGLGYGAICYLALHAQTANSQNTLFPALMLIGLLLKISIDFRCPSLLPSWGEAQPFVTVPLSHLIGVLTASALFVATIEENDHDSV